ncbi:MAG: flagellar basal body-associated FliL family protein [Sulfurimonas sp.]|nr:flagellar basal body-associated FliL family protein [Sulfurimonas sp.]
MQINKRKIIIKNASIVVLLLIILLLMVLGVQNSDFGKIKKYNSKDGSPRDMMTKFINSSGMQVTVANNNMANLGDFTFNIAGDRKLIANISLKYKSIKDDSWFSGGDETKKEILNKSAILRDAAINTMLGSSVATANSKKMRKALRNTLNNNLSSAEVEEVYFNEFIIQ